MCALVAMVPSRFNWLNQHSTSEKRGLVLNIGSPVELCNGAARIMLQTMRVQRWLAATLQHIAVPRAAAPSLLTHTRNAGEETLRHSAHPVTIWLAGHHSPSIPGSASAARTLEYSKLHKREAVVKHGAQVWRAMMQVGWTAHMGARQARTACPVTS
jgi:hypothetical protein